VRVVDVVLTSPDAALAALVRVDEPTSPPEPGHARRLEAGELDSHHPAFRLVQRLGRPVARLLELRRRLGQLRVISAYGEPVEWLRHQESRAEVSETVLNDAERLCPSSVPVADR
jgi:hypothetical protein